MPKGKGYPRKQTKKQKRKLGPPKQLNRRKPKKAAGKKHSNFTKMIASHHAATRGKFK